MKEQDDWKEKVWKEWVEFTNHQRTSEEVFGFIESLLSSQAQELKEQIKACVPKEKENMSGAGNEAMYNMGFNDFREKILSAIEIIEV